MSNKVMDLFERLDMFENDIRNSMVVYDREIIMGIKIVRDFIIELNPQDIDMEFIDNLRIMINRYQRELLSRMKIINKYTQYGIDKCLLIIENIIYLKDNLKNEKKKILNQDKSMKKY